MREYLKQKMCGLELLSFFLFLFSSMVVLQVGGYTLFLWIQCLFIIAYFIKKKKIKLLHDATINMLVCLLFISGALCQMYSLPDSYKKTAIVLPVMMVPLYLSCSIVSDMMRKEPIRTSEIILKAMRIALLIQLIWIPLQFVSYKFFGLDLNKAIFVDALHLIDNASFIRNWTYYPSGLTWHSAILAPLFVLGILLFRNPYIRTVILAESLICGNATTFIGVIICLILIFLHRTFKEKRRKLKRRTVIIIVAFCIVVPMLLWRFHIGEELINRAAYLWTRLVGADRDASTTAHLSYFSDYFKILKISSPLQVLFGYGYGCSGYPISIIYNRYTELTNWAIECDVIDILVSRGLIGFLLYYSFMFYIMIKGRKIDYRYSIFMLTVFIQGFGYNIQMDYLFMIEVIMYLSIKYKHNFFATRKNIENSSRLKLLSIAYMEQDDDFSSNGNIQWRKVP